MISLRPDAIKTVLCIGAHADDIEIGCGGTMLKLAEQYEGVEVRWVVLSGNSTRAAEARDASERFLSGVRCRQVDVQGFRDTCFPYSDAEALKDYFRQLSGDCKPDLIFTHRQDDAHQDHRLVAELTWQHFRNHLILEYEIPKYEGDLGRPNVFVPLTAEISDKKVESIMAAFPSQHEKPWFSPETFRALLRIRGVECQSQTGLAESFYCRKVVLG